MTLVLVLIVVAPVVAIAALLILARYEERIEEDES